MDNPAWSIVRGEGPLVAAAIHDGHEVRPELLPLVALSEPDRLREEDPYTGLWSELAPTRIVAHRSRFEVDLNRPRDKAVYLRPDDAWGLRVWHDALPNAVLERSYRLYDGFYQEVEALLGGLIERYGRVLVLDLHTYNHRRGGPQAPPDAADANPAVNVGTSNMDLRKWGPVAQRFEDSLRSVLHEGRPLDVRRNVKFQGGHFAQWVHRTFPEAACAPAVEVKKVFMDEWTGQLDGEAHAAIGRALAAAARDAVEVLQSLPENGGGLPDVVPGAQRGNKT